MAQKTAGYPRSVVFVILVLTAYQVIRLIVFANVYGGVEHDSGWFLGLARSLAETGSYTTMVSTIADPSPGGHQNIYGQYNVQNAEGRVYFFTESGVYVAGVLPNALIIKLFGAGFWQYRAGPLLFFLATLLLASSLLYRFGGLLAVILTHLFLLFYPHLSIFLGYEAMGEIFSLGYILTAFVLFLRALAAKQHRLLWFFACGLAAGLAVTTKPIALLSLGGLIPAWLLLFFLRKRHSSLNEGLIMIGGWVLLPIGWELTQLLSLTLLFDFQTYQHHLAQRLNFFANEGGSGLGTSGPNDLAFFGYKLLMVREISTTYSLISFFILLALLLGGAGLIWHYFDDPAQRSLFILLWGGWLIHTLWFVTFSKNGWVRHDWYALCLAVFLLSLYTAYAWRAVRHRPRRGNIAALIILATLLGFSFMTQLDTVSLFVSDKLVEQWYQKHLATNHTRIPWSLVPRQDQQDAVDFLNRLPDSARIFYPEGHKSAEMAVLTGHVLYPIERRSRMTPTANDVVLIGPSLISPWRKPTEAQISPADRQIFINQVLQQIKGECPRTVFENDYYIVCALN